ncbi:MAG TPA: carbamoyltransferase HypF [Gaiellaceae bacterium]
MTVVPPVERRRIRARGVVQGVGFRPFVHRIATGRGLGGFVLNDGDGVVIEVEGTGGALDAFADELVFAAPPQAHVVSVVAEVVRATGARGFEIRASESVGATALVPPDLATCDDCLRELSDPDDRRYRYPFLNCTQCGPRLTIVRGVPYDRARTTMDRFALCADCRREYDDPSDRRFHAEPIACPACGPRLSMPLREAVELLACGGIVAVKGLGGWHLACDAGDEAAVARLRARKRREEKPFALMTGAPDAICVVGDDERALLESSARPIVLLRRRDRWVVAPSVAPGASRLGVLLPYTPLHQLLWHDLRRPLVLTSGNLSDEPIVVDDDEARERLAGVADAFLGHDRPIHRRAEDSVVERGRVLRRSRGYAPSPLPLPVEAHAPIVAAGPELKATFCVARGREAFLSPHLGDLDNAAAYRAFRNDLALYLEMLGVEPQVVACDLHPEYLSTKWAHEQGLPVHEVQHHHAHAAACLAEHGEEEALALVFDGTGFGTDGTLWGGELLHARLDAFTRVGHLDAVPLPGGEAAVREPWRLAALHLERAGLPVPWPRWEEVRASLTVNAPLSSGAGRLFDAVAALLGVRQRVSYEGQAAIELERLAERGRCDAWTWRFGNPTTLVADCAARLRSGEAAEDVARGFHETLALAAAAACAESGACETVVLSGGTFQNRLLSEATRRRLEAYGFRVLEHERVPANDGGVSYGQAVVAACA